MTPYNMLMWLLNWWNIREVNKRSDHTAVEFSRIIMDYSMCMVDLVILRLIIYFAAGDEMLITMELRSGKVTSQNAGP